MTITVISIDIGLKNMAITFVAIEYRKIISLDFELCDLDDYATKYKNKVEQRCNAIKEIFTKISQKYNCEYFDYIIIEKQVPNNENAMCLMYSIYTMGTNYVRSPEYIKIFDPKLKFTTLCLSYDTKNKNHKKLSIELANKVLTNMNFIKLKDIFDKHNKKDDIADTINQAIVWLYKEDYLSSLEIKHLYEL